MKIVSKGFVEGYYYKPRVDMEVLETYHEGIIALVCLSGRRGRSRYLTRGMYEEAKASAAQKYERYFRKRKFFPGAAGSRHSGAADRSISGLLRMQSGDWASIWWLPTTCIILMKKMRRHMIFCSVSRPAKS